MVGTLPTFGAAMKWFDLTEEEVHALFFPGIIGVKMVEYGISKLGRNATKEQVAKNIIKFVKKKLRDDQHNLSTESRP